MGIDSTPMEGIEPELYDEILENRKYETLFAIAIDVKEETDANQLKFNPKSRLKAEKVILEAL